MAVFAVIYAYDPARHETRVAERPAHRALLGSLRDAGVLLAAGAWEDDGAPGALLIAQGASADEVAAAFDADPYHQQGVLAGREIRQWSQLMGPWSTPAQA